jgi:pyruvate,orthophosphate dikinase
VNRLPIVQDLILAETPGHRQAAIDKLMPIQREDFIGIFKAMAGLPVTIRLLDPPIHEFLPTAEQLEYDLSRLHHLRRAVVNMEELHDTLKMINPDLEKWNVEQFEHMSTALKQIHDASREQAQIARKEAMLKKVRQLHEVNPMLGHRGVRLGVTNPEIYAMQIRAILEAAATCVKEGVDVRPEIMVPQVSTPQELREVKKVLDQIVPEVEAAFGVKVPYKFGSMMEVVRACLRAEPMAKIAEFFSFGTNDLTQATFSFSREDAENKFLAYYLDHGIIRDNPFEILDVKGVGRLMEIAMHWGRKARPDLKVGICGEHGGQPEAIRFCHHIGLNYVSCSGPRVPVARLAAGRAKVLEKQYGQGLYD